MSEYLEEPRPSTSKQCNFTRSCKLDLEEPRPSTSKQAYALKLAEVDCEEPTPSTSRQACALKFAEVDCGEPAPSTSKQSYTLNFSKLMSEEPIPSTSKRSKAMKYPKLYLEEPSASTWMNSYAMMMSKLYSEEPTPSTSKQGKSKKSAKLDWDDEPTSNSSRKLGIIDLGDPTFTNYKKSYAKKFAKLFFEKMNNLEEGSGEPSPSTSNQGNSQELAKLDSEEPTPSTSKQCQSEKLPKLDSEEPAPRTFKKSCSEGSAQLLEYFESYIPGLIASFNKFEDLFLDDKKCPKLLLEQVTSTRKIFSAVICLASIMEVPEGKEEAVKTYRNKIVYLESRLGEMEKFLIEKKNANSKTNSDSKPKSRFRSK